MGRFVRVTGVGDVVTEDFASALHASGIVSNDLAALLQQRLHDGDGGRLADVIRPAFESETEYAKPLAA